MKEDNKTKKQFTHELQELRLQNAELKKTIAESISVEEASSYAENIVETVREPLLVLDSDLKIISANRNFYTTFEVTPDETIGSFIYNLGNRQWDIPKLRELLETILPEKTTFDNYEVEHNFATIGRRIMLLNARQIKRAFGKERIILLAIEDITERKRLEDLLSESEERFRRLFETASDGIVLLEKSEGKITHANPAIEKMLGYAKKESIGNKLQDIGVLLDIDDFQTTMQNLNKRGILNYNDVPVKTKSGQYIDTDIYLVDRAMLVQCNIRDTTERKQAQDKLRQSEAYFKAIIENPSDIILIVDKMGTITYASPSVERILGYRSDELIGKSSLDLIVSDDKPRAVTDFGRSLLIKDVLIPNVFRIKHKNGTERVLEGFGKNLLDNKVVAGFVMNVRDITKRKQTEDNIRQLTDAMEAAIDGMALLNKDEEYIYLNRAHARIYGYENTGELIGKSWRTLYEADEIKRFDAEIMPNFGQKGYWQGRTQGMKKDGSKFPQEISLTALGSGGLICIVRDITDREQEEEALRNSKAQLSNALEIARLGHWEYDVANDLFTFNDEFYKIFRTTVDQVGGYTMHSAEYARRFVYPDDMNMVGEETRKAIETTDPHFNRQIEHRMLYADGTVGYITVRFFIVKDSHGRTVKTYGVNQDITEHKKADEQLRDTLESLRKAVGTTIQAMVSAVETRDPYTSGHQIRSADLARAIAAEMGLSQDKIDGIRMAGSIHDIGKLSIPAEILSKPTKLSEIEFSLIKEHSRHGYEILKNVESPWPLAEMIYQHHEKMDGSGYPRHLKGNDILIEARILAVADVVEAMASHRPYRPALGIDKALEEISKNSGILYDPEVVDTCLRLFNEKGYKFE